MSGGKKERKTEDLCCHHNFMISQVHWFWKHAGLLTVIEEGFVGRQFLNQADLDQWWNGLVNLKWGPGYQVVNAFVVFLAVVIPEADGGIFGMSSEKRKMWV